MENIIFPTEPRLLGCVLVSDVVFSIFMIEYILSHTCSIYFEAYYINGLTTEVNVPSCFNIVKIC